MADKPQWTPAQRTAIEETDRTLLVSAAAGSGKTAVLTERIVRALTDQENPTDITRMLIVTFTRAAAAEMKERIAKKLNEAAAGKRNPHITRQLLLLPGAHICTIDSYCQSLVRTHATRLGISPAFRLADAAENRLLLHSILDRLVEECYAGTAGICENEEFCDLVDCLTGGRDDGGLGDILLALYEKTHGFAGTYRILTPAVEELRSSIGKAPFATPWGAYLREQTASTVRAAMTVFDDLLAAVRTDEKTARAYAPALQADLDGLMALASALDAGYSETRAAVFDFTRARLGSLKAEFVTEDSLAARAYRSTFYERTLKNLRTRYAYTAEQWQECLPALADRVDLLAKLLCEFEGRVSAEKRRRSLCDFSDLEHYALALLCEEDGSPTPLAREIRREFDWVYIDEYQDVNEVQHRIFEALSSERNRFMVGDVKQSIYGFRGAQPEIFAGVRRAYPPESEAGNSPNATVSLSANFRSTPNILAFVNHVFGQLMSGIGEKIDYRPEEDELNPGVADAACGEAVEVVFFEKAPTPSEEEEEDREEREEEDGELPDAEAMWVAKKIKELLAAPTQEGEKQLRPRDIAILARSSRPLARYAAALDRLGIQSEMSAKRGFFLNPEILLALSLLNTVDNPRRDIHLAGILRSPVYRFSMDDLVAVRQEADAHPDMKNCTLYEALRLYAETHPQKEKPRRFLHDLENFRALAESWPVDRLIWHIYRETGLLSLAGGDKDGDPESRRENLMLLYNYARTYEASSYRGLHSFIAYINEAIERGQSIEESGKMSEREETVRLMTIHQSKGLEFRACFLSDCGRGFNKSDTRAPLLFDRRLGCAVKLRDETGFVRLRNPVYNAVADSIRDAAIEEESRVLYVALTRAKERLFVTATVGKEMLLRSEADGFTVNASDVYACASYAEMLAKTAFAHPSYHFRFIPYKEENPTPCVAKTEETAETQAGGAEEEALFCTFSARFSHVYEDASLGDLPSKLSVSQLYPAVLDGSEEEFATVAPPQDEVEFTPVVPRFLSGEKKSAADAGTATHLFLQFCDFARLREEGAAAELARLTARGFLPEEKASLVRLDEIEKFRHSALLSELLAGGKLYRELRFNVRLPATAFTEDEARRKAYAEESVLVQGVMDGVLVGEDGRLTLFDYKTDRLTQEEKANPTLAAEKLLARHRLQLGYYAAACARIFGRLPDRVAVYSLALGDTVDLPREEIPAI